MPRIALGQAAFLGTLLGAASLRLPIALDLPAAYFAVLASAHIYEIVLDIVFWVVVAAFLDTIELKRGTPLIYMALATGGVAGGLASALSPVVPTEDLLLALPALGVRGRPVRARRTPAAGAARSRRARAGPARPGRAPAPAAAPATRYPLILLIALNATMLTILYGLCEYLVLTVYAQHFESQIALTRFLALVFAGIQVLEFALLYLAGPARRAGPIARNLIFPASSLVCLIGLAISPKLPAAIATHINAEAVSNAIFQPVNNTNYLALPLRFHGRIRMLADGVFYPAGLALAGGMLLTLQAQLAPAQINFVAITFALVFIALNIGAACCSCRRWCRTSALASRTPPPPPGRGRRSPWSPTRSALCCAAAIPRPGRSGSRAGWIRRRSWTSCARSRRPPTGPPGGRSRTCSPGRRRRSWRRCSTVTIPPAS